MGTEAYYELINRLSDNIAKMEQIEQLRSIFDNYNEKRNVLLDSVMKFEKAVNVFFEESSNKKYIQITYRTLYFTLSESEKMIPITQLSSGEKQIIIFLAYLVFEVMPAKQPIFMIDEPEMSLHLEWQRKFIRSIVESNPDIQLIVATHSPEIIEKYDNKTRNIKPEIKE